MFNSFLYFICILMNSSFMSSLTTECSSREFSTFDDCYNQYLSNFGYNTFWWYSNYTSSEQREIWNDISNAMKVCEKFNNLKNCLGNSVSNMCLTEDTLKLYYNIDKSIAKEYIIDYKNLDFMCNEGKQVFTNVYDCAKNNHFEVIIKADNSSNCETAEGGASNIFNVAKNKCKDDGFILACNILKNQLSVYYEECDNLFCTADSSVKYNFSLFVFLLCFIIYF